MRVRVSTATAFLLSSDTIGVLLIDEIVVVDTSTHRKLNSQNAQALEQCRHINETAIIHARISLQGSTSFGN